VRDKLFDPFFTTKPVGKGTGLGLSICYGIVTKLGGRLWVEHPPSGGAAFKIYLPQAGPQKEVA
jgi:two-component system NtrC family sensor kinase